MFERFAAPARDAVVGAVGEARRRGDRRVGTDHLLIGVLGDPAIADLVGADAGAARRAADELDRRALAEIGLDIGEFGSLTPAAGGSHLPFTPGAKQTLKRTLAHLSTKRSRRIESRHLVLALLERDRPDAAAVILAELRVDPRQVRERIGSR
jgi:ATP-dependent Clp protease ATP-binding subunit ClpA